MHTELRLPVPNCQLASHSAHIKRLKVISSQCKKYVGKFRNWKAFPSGRAIGEILGALRQDIRERNDKKRASLVTNMPKRVYSTRPKRPLVFPCHFPAIQFPFFYLIGAVPFLLNLSAKARVDSCKQVLVLSRKTRNCHICFLGTAEL